MAEAVYILCALTSVACALLLYRSFRDNRVPLLFWSTFCFVFLAVNNVLLVVDLLVVPSVDLSVWRSVVAAVALGALLFALVWETR